MKQLMESSIKHYYEASEFKELVNLEDFRKLFPSFFLLNKIHTSIDSRFIQYTKYKMEDELNNCLEKFLEIASKSPAALRFYLDIDSLWIINCMSFLLSEDKHIKNLVNILYEVLETRYKGLAMKKYIKQEIIPITGTITDTRILESIKAESKNRSTGELINLNNIFIPGHWFVDSTEIDNVVTFKCPVSAIKLRTLFKYYAQRIRNLEEMGFIYSTKTKVLIIYSPEKDVKYYSKPQMDNVSYVNIEEGVYKKFYREIIGFNRQVHEEFINKIYSRFIELKHQPHKPHKQHVTANGTGMHKDAKLYIHPSTGKQISVIQYAEEKGISRQGAYKALKKSA